MLVKCATTGSSICYGLSDTLAKYFVLTKFPSKLILLHKKMVENRNSLPYFMLFLRFTPLIPNVVVNMGAPIVGMPLHLFALGTFFGLMPANIVHIKAGIEVSDFDPTKNGIRIIGMMLILSALVLIPTYFTKKIKVEI